MSIFKRKIDLENQGNDFVEEEEIYFKIDLPEHPEVIVNPKTKSITLTQGGQGGQGGQGVQGGGQNEQNA